MLAIPALHLQRQPGRPPVSPAGAPPFCGLALVAIAFSVVSGCVHVPANVKAEFRLPEQPGSNNFEPINAVAATDKNEM